MNPLALPVGIATRVLGDLAALAAAARAVVPVAEAAGELDFRQIQDDLHTLARVAEDLPRVEGELTRRMDEAEDSLERAVKAAEALVDGMPEITAGIAELRGAREAAEQIVASLPVITDGIGELRRATKAAEALADAAPDIQAGIPELARARAAAEKLTDSIPLLERMTDVGEKLAGEGLDEVRASRKSLAEAKVQADQLIAASERAQGALDRASENVELALARAEPLQGLTERIARLNERLPGGGRGGSAP
jgi:methyl-accepting chemotaxis protein